MSDQIAFEPVSDESSQQPDGSSPGLWEQIGKNLGVGGYEALNQYGMGIPDWILNKVAPARLAAIKEEQQLNPVAATVGDIAGTAGTFATPFKDLLAPLAAGSLAEKVPGLFKLAGIGEEGAKPLGLVGSAVRGALQTLPQTAIRTATGNITPQEGLTGLELGTALGGLSGIAGGLSGAGKLSRPLQDTVDDWTLGTAGVRSGMISKAAKYGLNPAWKMSQLARAGDLKSMTAKLIRDNNLTPENFADWYAAGPGRVFKTVDQGWDNLGIPLPAAIEGALKSPELTDLKEAVTKQNPVFSKIINTIQDATGGEVGLPTISEISSGLTKDAAMAPAEQRMIYRGAQNAMEDLRNWMEDQGSQAAIKAGSLNPGDLDYVKKIYGPLGILKDDMNRQAAQVSFVSPGSPTFEKAMMGALAGPELIPGGEKKSPGEILGDMALGAVGGNLVAPLLAKGGNKIMGGLAKILAGGGGEGGNILGKVASAAGGPLAQRIEQTIPALSALIPPSGAQAKQAPNPLETPLFTTAPTYEQLAADKSPYAQYLAQLAQNAYGGHFFIKVNPETGKLYTLDDVVKQMWQNTNGFTPEASGPLLTQPGGNPEAMGQDIQIAKALHGIDWPALSRWYGRPLEGGLSPLRGVASAIGIGQAREASQEFQQLLSALPPNSRAIVAANIQRIMQIPGLNEEERKKQAEESVMNAEGVFTNPALMQELGFVQ